MTHHPRQTNGVARVSVHLPSIVALLSATVAWWALAGPGPTHLDWPFRVGAIGLLLAGFWSAGLALQSASSTHSRVWRLGLLAWATSPLLLILAVSFQDSPPLSTSVVPQKWIAWLVPILRTGAVIHLVVSWWLVPILCLVSRISFRQGGAAPAILCWATVPLFAAICGMII